jgi:hypothetical protein
MSPYPNRSLVRQFQTEDQATEEAFVPAWEDAWRKRKFDPAPKAKHAEDPKQAQKSDRAMHDKSVGSRHSETPS